MKYGEYLLSCLLKKYDKEFNELEYDIQFDAITLLYSNFEKSIFCVDSLGEYESMLNYLKHKYHAFYVLKVFFTRNNGYTFKLEIQFTLTSEDDIINYAVDNKYNSSRC
jgi:hypothetical protein